LAAELQRRYPEIVNELISLTSRIAPVNAEVMRVTFQTFV
jgi:hypothetical protein